ncbi:MAG: TonB-dependent receptor [Caulobacteraceae bacterium]
MKSTFRSQALAAASLAALSLAATAGIAHAQSATTGESAASESVEEIVVTGSRISRRDYVANSPILTLPAATLLNQSGISIDTKIAQLPQFTPGATRFAGSGQSTANLRGLGTSRNLVLVDGRRPMPSSAQLVVDLNSIPTGLIDNVEVITGGASAVYGSDAISGVLNFKLKRNFQGLQMDAQYGRTERGDGEETEVNILAGGNFADDRGNAVVGLNYANRGRIYSRDRDFYRTGIAAGATSFASVNLPTGQFVADSANQPTLAARNALFGGYGTPVTTAVVGTNYGFNTDGTLFTLTGGRNFRGVQPVRGGYYQLNPAGNVVFELQDNVLQVPLQRYSAFAKVDYNITPNIRFYAQATFTRYDTQSQGTGASTNGPWNLIMPADNVFIPADLKTLLNSRPSPNVPFTMIKYFTQTGALVTDYKNQLYQITTGFAGDFGKTDWTWDIYGSTGQTTILATTTGGAPSIQRMGTLMNSRSYLANGALVNVPEFLANSNGTSVTINPLYLAATGPNGAAITNDGGRSVVSLNGGPNPCPNGLNLFGDKPLDASCIGYITKNPKQFTSLRQDVVEASAQGTAFSLPAGEVKLAVGASYRRNTYNFIPDSSTFGVTTSDVVNVFPSNPTGGFTDSKEAYIEGLIPVLKDVPFIKSFEISPAYRYASYNNAGSIHTYKADFNWEVISGIRFRGGYERAVRAPNVGELFQGSAPGAAGALLRDPCDFNSPENIANPAKVSAICAAQGLAPGLASTYRNTTLTLASVVVGNPNLEPEKADTFTVGAVWQPSFSHPLLSRVRASVDYYDIKVTKAIAAINGSIIFQKCFNQDGSNPSLDAANPNCGAIIRQTSTGLPLQVNTPYGNIGALKTSGIDFQVDWGVDLADVGLGKGSVAVNLVGTYLREFNIQAVANSPFLDYAGTIGNSTVGTGTFPRWKATMTTTYAVGPGSLGLRWFYIDGMKDFTAISSPSSRRVGTPGYMRFDLFGSYALNKMISLRAGVDNLANKDPVVFGGILGTTESGTYDPAGRRYWLAVRAKM